MVWKSRGLRSSAQPSSRAAPGPVLRRPASRLKPKAVKCKDRRVADVAIAVHAGASTPGPRDFASAMDDWAQEQRKALAGSVPGSMTCLREVRERGIDVTTHYSGTGAAEMACAALAPGRVTFHGACDFNPMCRNVLLHHAPESAAEHVTQDLCQRPPPHVVEELRAELRRRQLRAGIRAPGVAAKQSNAQKARASTPSSMPRRERVRAAGLKWVDAAMRILSQWVPAREDGALCCRHDRNCPAFPPRTRRLHLEIDGVNCQPWTAAGLGLGWLDDRSIPCLILVQTILSVGPDAVCIECTPRFDFATLQRLLRTYRGDKAVTCPTDFGRPVARPRMYMWFDRIASVRRVHKEVSSILDVSRRALRVGPEIFLQASPAEVQRHHLDLANASASTPCAQESPPTTLSDVLPAGLRTRYEQHRDKVAEVRRSPRECYVVDINKTVGWGGPPVCHRVPTILRSSMLVAFCGSPEQDRALLPSEMLGIHGIRLPTEVMATLAPRQVRSLVGNSMHVAQIGCFVQYALATRSYVLDSEGSAEA